MNAGRNDTIGSWEPKTREAFPSRRRTERKQHSISRKDRPKKKVHLFDTLPARRTPNADDLICRPASLLQPLRRHRFLDVLGLGKDTDLDHLLGVSFLDLQETNAL